MKKLFALTLMTIFMLAAAGCAPGSTFQINTPVPAPKSGTPAPNGQISIPAINIQFNAPGPNPLVNQPDKNGQIAGALMGIWHGVISPVTMLLSFVNPDVQMVEVHNNGSPYNVGFFLGVFILFIISGVIVSRRRR